MTGTIEGTVSTDEGDGIEDATITIADAATEKLEATTTTDENGEYSASVAPDTYDVRAQKIGFAAAEERITVGIDVTKTVNLTLAELSVDVVGEITDGPGIGVLGTVSDDSGSSIGVQGEVASDAGYGLYTPNDARIDGSIDTTETWKVVVDGKRGLQLATAEEVENQTASGSAVVGHLNAVDAGVMGAVIAGGGLYDQDHDEPLGNRVTDHFGTIGGGVDNVVGDGDDDPGSADGGTVSGGFHNEATDRNATVAGGRDNEASGSSSTIGGGTNNEASGPSSTVGGGSSNTVSDRESTVGGGWRNTASGRRSATVGGGRQNTASGARSTISGGELNEASGERSTVGGGGRNEASGARSTVSGGRQNTASDMYATIGGGERLEASGARSTVSGGISNTASGSSSTVGGGLANTASGENATVGGGRFNEASGEWSTVGGGAVNEVSGKQSVVGGGRKNEAKGPRNTIAGGYENSVAGWTSTVGGGWTNTASDRSSTVGGGEENTASGDRATVPGGFLNDAAGDFSFAVGRQAKANHDGAVVFADSSSTEITSNGSDEARFQMEVYAPKFNTTSARSAKTNVESVDPIAALEGVNSLEISTWEFREHGSGRHMGPMAGEFAETFELGTDDSISTVDSDGVAFAAIQGLSQKLDEKNDRIDDLEERLSTLESRVGSDY